MRDVPQIKAAYDWMIIASDVDVGRVMAIPDLQAAARLDETRDPLERGIFVLLFGPFEKEVTECFNDAVMARATNPDWTRRRGWDIPSYNSRRIPFETKLALVLDQQSAAHRQVMDAYARRNHCAHGGSSLPAGSIDQFVQDLFTWQAALRR